MAHAESRKVCFDIIRERLKELNNVSKTMYPSVGYKHFYYVLHVADTITLAVYTW